MITVKLANVLLRPDDHAAAHPELYYRAEPGAVEPADGGPLRARGRVDFLTYLNALPACKWRRYAGIGEATLRLELAGAGTLLALAVDEGADAPRVLAERAFDAPGGTALDVPFALAGEDLVGFAVEAAAGSEVSISAGRFEAAVDEADLNDVRLAISTTTFENEDLILPNIRLIRDLAVREREALGGRFHLFVVDNGRTLDAASLSDELVTVIPNPNTGGSGGFARGMMAATETPGAFTHVLVMDDDVRVLPESFLRTFSLLRLARGRYRGAFLNGAMLSLEEPSRQFEDVSFVKERGIYFRVKEDLEVGRLSDVLANERADVEVPRAYGAWWYSCIPVSAIERNGLPMPFFIRCDDVEFGERNRAVFMTMGGICVWHASFEGRFRASVDCYQHVRNFLAMVAVDGCASERMFMARLRFDIRQSLRDLDYASAEMLVAGLEDYLKGPDFLARADGAALMREHGAANERMVPVGELDPDLLARAGVTPGVLARGRVEPQRPSAIVKLLRVLVPYDKHYLPDALLRSEPGHMVKHGLIIVEGSSMRRRELVCLDPTRRTAAVRTMDRARFRALRARERAAFRLYRARGGEVRAAWRAAAPRLTSRPFWTAYLGLSEGV